MGNAEPGAYCRRLTMPYSSRATVLITDVTWITIPLSNFGHVHSASSLLPSSYHDAAILVGSPGLFIFPAVLALLFPVART